MGFFNSNAYVVWKDTSMPISVDSIERHYDSVYDREYVKIKGFLSEQGREEILRNLFPVGKPPTYWFPSIEKVIFNDPATIIFWSDRTKTVVKVQDGEKFDKMTGLAMGICKKVLGNKGNYYNEFSKWIGEEA